MESLLYGCNNEDNDVSMSDGCIASGETSYFAPGSPAPFIVKIGREEVESGDEFAQFWDQVTLENAGKRRFVETERDVMVWRVLDMSFQYAEVR